MGDNDILKTIADSMKKSELLASLTTIGRHLVKPGSSCASDGARLVNLTKEQVQKLKRNGNFSSDWKKVLVQKGFAPERVRNSSFHGEVSLGAFDERVNLGDGVELDSGVYNSQLVDCHVGNNALISDVKHLSRYIVKDGACLFNDGIVSCHRGATFGNGTEIPLAIETGGREVRLYAEITVEVAQRIATSRADSNLLSGYDKAVNGYVKKITSDFGVIEEGAIIKNTSKVIDVYLGSYGIIDNAQLVQNSIILSNREEKVKITDGAYVRNSIIQWGSEVTSGGIVDSSCLTEHSHVERHGKVTQSLLGPNTGVGEGEITASLVGPFVGFHHQALLIAAMWPEGKGNVGYGANVGSNHTSKAPDQEIWPGEGAFFGLGVNIKFPSDFTKAPYLIIASNVNTLPQKVTFPFSLLNAPAQRLAGVSPAFNEIFPGWVLSDNIFTIKRNEGKYLKRNKARRSKFVFEVFRPDIVDMMLDARKRLSQVKQKKEFYTEADIPGLGKNYLLEKNRLKGIEAYTFYIKYYGLLGLRRKLKELASSGEKEKIAGLLTKTSDDSRWEHERKVLGLELKDKDASECLKLLVQMQEKIAQDVQTSKEKDDQRGQRIIADYSQAHPPASKDSFVKETWANFENTKKEVGDLLKRL